jgi:hypothetical protein
MEYNTHTDSFSGHASSKGVEITLGHDKGQTTVTHSSSFDTYSGFEVAGDVLSTAKTPTGAPVLGREVQPSDTIMVHGQRMSVGIAQSLGFLKAGPNGGFQATEEGTAGAPKAEGPKGQTVLESGGTAEEAAENSFRGTEQAEALLAEAVNTVPAGLLASAVDEFMANDGNLSPHLLQRVADASRMGTAEAMETIADIQGGMVEGLGRHLAPLGVYDLDAFSAFLHSSHDTVERMRASGKDLMMYNSTKGFEDLARDFAASADMVDPVSVDEALTEAGIRFTRTPQGVSLDLRKQGLGQIPFRHAVKEGIIKLSRRG